MLRPILSVAAVLAAAAAAPASAQSTADELSQSFDALQSSMSAIAPEFGTGAPLDAGKLCDVCESYVDMINSEMKMLKDGWAKVRGPFQEECDKCPVEPVRDGCAAVTGFVDSWLGDLSPLEPAATCSSVGLCQEDSSDAVTVSAAPGRSLADFGFNSPSAEFCTSCQQADDMVKNVVKGVAEYWTTLRERLSQECGNITVDALKQACQQGLDKFDRFVAMVASTVASMKPCEQLGCDAPEVGLVAAGTMVTDYASPADAAAAGARLRGAAVDAVCNSCKGMSHWLAGVLRRVAEGMDAACDPITDPEKHDRCEANVAQVTAAAQSAADALEADKLCFMCSTASDNNWATRALILLGSGAADGQLCGMCAAASDAVKAKVVQLMNMWQQVAVESRKICKQLPDELTGVCMQQIAALDGMLRQAASKIQGADVCSMLGCSDAPPVALAAAQDVAVAAALA